METIFIKLLNMSLTACVLILAVLAARVLLKKAPRWSICLLWGLVALRLICPFTLESNLSLIRTSEPIVRENLSVEIPTLPAVTEPVYDELTESIPEVQQPSQLHVSVTPEGKAPGILTVAGYLWLTGVGGMLLYALGSFWQLKRRVATATRLEGNIRQSECVTSPFVLGIFRPTIYLPYGLKEFHLNHILAHERAHIRRGDHLIKPLGFMILSVHWFNPLVWVAYILLCRDIEAACDERVIKDMTHEQRQAYSATLLRCSVHRRRIAACPVAFGETEIKGRIKNVMNYKKPTVWLIVMSVLLSLLLAGCFLTDPVKEQPQEQLSVNREDQAEMEALVDQIVDEIWNQNFSSIHPDHYRMINAQAREKLLSYGEDALEYLTSRLRSTESDTHSLKEQIMVFACEDLAKVTTVNNRYNSGWWENPGEWLTMYDMYRADKNDKSRLQPGFYEVGDVLYGNLEDRMAVVGQDLDTVYMVTDNGIFIRNYERRYDIINSFDGVTVENGDYSKTGILRTTYSAAFVNCTQVDWKWEESSQSNNLWDKLKKGKRDKWKEFGILDILMGEQEYQYQQLDENRCMIKTGTGLYSNVYLIGQSKGQLHYVYLLRKIPQN